jgi:hypothetical protein
MSWLASLDAKAQHWPTLTRSVYVGAKWLLIALGAWVLGGLLLQRLNPQYWRDMLG